MSDPRIDGRPRLLDFSAPIADVRASRNMGWPCYAFRVTVPVRATGRLNIFEETVLRLLDNARLDEKLLAEQTCLHPSLIRLVCSRLRDLGMVTEHNEVTSVGSSHLSQAEDAPHDYEVRWVFRERVGGKLLPAVYEGELRCEELAKWDRAKRVALIRKGHRMVPVRLLRGQDGGVVHPPEPADVIWATRRHKELSQQYAVMRLGVPPCPAVDRLEQMNVDPNPEAVFLRCRAVIPATADDYRITDPFGYGFSEILFRFFEELRARDHDEERFVHDLRTSATTVRQTTPDDDARAGEIERAVLSVLAESVRDYGELFGKLRQAEFDFRKSDHPPRSADQEAHFHYHAQQAAQSLSEAIETTLAHIATKWRPAACEALLGSGSHTPAQNADLLQKIARRLGLRTDAAGSLLHVAPGRVRALREGDVDLQALVAVSLAAAVEADEHPIRRLADQFDGWLEFLWRLKRMRDLGAHGQTRKAGASVLAWLRGETYRALKLLLPRLERAAPGPAPARAAPSTERLHDERRLAISRLEQHFGVQWYSRIDTDAAGLLVQIEMTAAHWQRKAGKSINVGRTVNDLASLLQAFAHARQSPGDEPSRSVAPPHLTATRRATEAGLLKAGACLPASIARVNRRRLDEALQGRSPSLGANVLSLLLTAPMEWLRALAAVSPGFLAHCERLLDLRGHGNQPVFMTAEEALALKDDVYKVCVALMEA